MASGSYFAERLTTKLAGSRSIGSGRWRGFGNRGGRRQAGIDPAGMNPAIQGFLGLGIDISLPDQAAESGLDMGAGTAQPIV